MASLDNFVLDSRHPMEKVAGMFEFSATAQSGLSASFANSVGVALLLDGQYSFVEDFSVAYPITAWDIDRNFQLAFLTCTNSQITIDATGYGGSMPIYFRLWGFLPEDYSASVQRTGSISQYPFTINSRKNYMKVFKNGRLTIQDGSSATIAHNLGFVPFARVWEGTNSRWTLYDQSAHQSTMQLTTSNLIIKNDIGSATSFYYRIYANEA